MKQVMKLLLMWSVLSAGVQLHAYTFTFRNKTQQKIAVKIQLDFINESHTGAIDIRPGEKHDFTFDGWKIGFCMNGNTVQLKKEGDADFTTAPVVFVTQQMYNQWIAEALANKGKISRALDNIPARVPGICFNHTFDIVLDAKENPRVIMPQGF